MAHPTLWRYCLPPKLMLVSTPFWVMKVYANVGAEALAWVSIWPWFCRQCKRQGLLIREVLFWQADTWKAPRATREVRATQTWEGRFHGVLKMRNSYFSQCPSGSGALQRNQGVRNRLKSINLGYLFLPCHSVLPIGNLKNVSPVGVGGQALAGFYPGT